MFRYYIQGCAIITRIAIVIMNGKTQIIAIMNDHYQAQIIAILVLTYDRDYKIDQQGHKIGLIYQNWQQHQK